MARKSISRFGLLVEGKKMSMIYRLLAASGLSAISLIVGAGTGFAGPKEVCQEIVGGLGFETSVYRFEQGGIFSSDQHIFGDLSCYVTADGQFDSLYRRETPVAEDGFFGYQALENRDKAISAYELLDEEAQKKRDEAIAKARADYDAEFARITGELEKQLNAIRTASDPRGAKTTGVGTTQAPEITPTTSQPAQTVENEQTMDVPKQKAGSKTELDGVNGQEMWVTAERVNIRSCPMETCGRTGWVQQGYRIVILEERDGWGRIDEPIPAMCENGTTSLIDDGDKRCLPENGVVDGMMARWLNLQFLSTDRPEKTADPAACAGGFLSSSDNYATYAETFCQAARQLIDDGECTEKDFADFGGWSASAQYSQGTFFTYCGGMMIENKIYLDAKTGRVFRQ